jgi:hypothetical protein
LLQAKAAASNNLTFQQEPLRLSKILTNLLVSYNSQKTVVAVAQGVFLL